MKKYLKMADVFDGAVNVKYIDSSCIHELRYGDESGDNYTLQDEGFWMLVRKEHAEYAAHAINSHDELVQMNQELLSALEAVIEWYDMEADHSIEPDFYKRMAACQISEDMAREVITKAKGGAS